MSLNKAVHDVQGFTGGRVMHGEMRGIHENVAVESVGILSDRQGVLHIDVLSDGVVTQVIHLTKCFEGQLVVAK